jgi:chromosome transmission fidelity protein 1
MQPFDLLVRELFPSYTPVTAGGGVEERQAGTSAPSPSAPQANERGGPLSYAFAFSHVVPERNFVVRTLSVGLRGTPLALTHAHRAVHRTMLDDAGRAIAALCRVIPKGVVVFFTSYEMERLFFEVSAASGALDELSRLKRVYREADGSPVEELLARYAKHVHSAPAAGALLSAVMGGKLSEGINFADDLARAVIVVGLPYPNPHDARLKLTMSYLREKHAAASPHAAQRYYDALCMRSVNQAVGRCLRHAGDHAAIVLLDQRFSSDAVRAQLPRWLVPRYAACTGFFGDTLRSIREFFADHAPPAGHPIE